jgi:hypothetical protein
MASAVTGGRTPVPVNPIPTSALPPLSPTAAPVPATPPAPPAAPAAAESDEPSDQVA